MNKNSLFKIISLLLALSMIILTFTACGKKEDKIENPILDSEINGTEYKQTQYDKKAKNVKKEETVYINTKPDGSIYNVTVTDWLHTDTPQVYIDDKSTLMDVVNVNTLTKPRVSKNGLIWDMDTTDLYYSGVTKKAPPVTFNIKYFLEGNELTAEEIAGKKGHVAIEISMESSLKEKYMIKGKEYTITCPMLVFGGTILPENTFINIAIDYGTAISDGSKQVVFFAGIPGIDESLGLSELNLSSIDKSIYTNKYTITAYTESFEMGNLMFAATPFSSVGSMGVGGLTDGIDRIKSVLSDVEAVQDTMNSLGLKKIVDLLYGDAGKVEEMLNSVEKASQIYKENEKMLKVFGSYMTDENIEKLNKLIVDLENTDIDALSKTLEDPILKQILHFLPKFSESLKSVSILADDINELMPIFESLSKDIEDPDVKESLENLPETIKELNDIINVLKKNKDLIESISDFSSKDNLEQMESIIDTADKYMNLSELSSEQLKTLADRMKKWITYGSSYKIFTDAPQNASTTVLFTYKTDSIKIPNEEKVTENVEETADNKFVSFFKNLFK